jgi:hypothetical protein
MKRRLSLTILVFIVSVMLPTVPAAAAAAPSTAAGFTSLFASRNDWTWSGGDQVTTFRAANGVTYWSFGDTAIGEQDPVTGGYRPGWRMLSNTILAQRGDALSATTWEAAVPDPGDGDRYWTQGMFQAGGYLYVQSQRVRNVNGFFELRGVDLAKFAVNSDGSLAFRGMVGTPSTGALIGDSVATAQYSSDAVVSGAYVYVFGFSNEHSDSLAPHRSYVARVPVGSVESAAAWRFRDAAGQWVSDKAQAAPILRAQISSVRSIGGRWVLAYKPWNGWGDKVFIESRPTPWGAPTGTVTIDSPAGTTPAGIAYQTYSPQLHPEQSLASGKLLVSIAWNATDFADLSRDADLYKPRFHEVALPS